jgi:hypothetical protein
MDITLVLYSQIEALIYSYVLELEDNVQSGQFFFLKSGNLVQIESIIYNENNQEKIATCRLVLYGISGEHDGKKLLLPFGYIPPTFAKKHFSDWEQKIAERDWDWVVATTESLQMEDIQE